MKDYNTKIGKNRVYKIVKITFFMLIFLITISLFFIAVSFDNDKSCQSNGGVWNEEKSRCEDNYGNKLKF